MTQNDFFFFIISKTKVTMIDLKLIQCETSKWQFRKERSALYGFTKFSSDHEKKKKERKMPLN